MTSSATITVSAAVPASPVWADPAVADAIYALAFAMIEAEQWADALDVLRAMLLAWPTDERGWLGLAHCHEQRGQVDVAIELYSLAIASVSRPVRARVGLARLLRERGSWRDADDLLDAAASDAEASDQDELERLVVEARRAS